MTTRDASAQGNPPPMTIEQLRRYWRQDTVKTKYLYWMSHRGERAWFATERIRR